jgi:hypothetical protein
MDQKTQKTKPIGWRESWAPAFDRLLVSIAALDKLTRG